MDKLDVKKENRHTRLLELGLGTKDEIIENISNKFIREIIKGIRQDTKYHFRKQNKEVFEEILIKSSKKQIEGLINSFDNESLEKILIKYNQNGKN